MATVGYRAWGWPVTLGRDQIRLNLDGDIVALIIPGPLATEVTEILAHPPFPRGPITWIQLPDDALDRRSGNQPFAASIELVNVRGQRASDRSPALSLLAEGLAELIV